MPLLDHFHPPFTDNYSWDMIHGGLPMVIATHLNGIMPSKYVAGPTVNIGSGHEVDVRAFEKDMPAGGFDRTSGGNTATAVWMDTDPTLAVAADWSRVDDYEVFIYDRSKSRELVASIEIVSPSNKDRPESRRLFVGKCATLLKRGVSVAIVDFVTERLANLYAELMQSVGHPDPVVGDPPTPIYAVAIREGASRGKRLLESWFHPLAVGQPLPQLPLWLTDRLAVTLDLEPLYEQTLRSLRII